MADFHFRRTPIAAAPQRKEGTYVMSRAAPDQIFNSADYIDIRDVIARVEHLEQLRQPGPVDLGPDDSAEDQDDLFRELAGLESVLDELRGRGGDHQWRGDWYPVTLIRDSAFEDYARDLAEDIGAVSPDASWPRNHIDWASAAAELQDDYSPVRIDGVTYWYR